MSGPSNSKVSIRHADTTDLDAINSVIEAAIMSWDLPERVKRLALSSYLYQPHDLDHIELWVAETAGNIVGLASLEPADTRELPDDQQGLLLHGLYVDPAFQQQGIGSQLLKAAEQQVQAAGLDGLLVRAQSEAADFFSHNGLQLLPADKAEAYQHRYWKAVNA